MNDDPSKLDAALKDIAKLAKVHPKLDAALNKIAIRAEVQDACAGPGVRTKRDSFRSLMLGGLREGRQLHLSKVKILLFPKWTAVDGHLKEIALAAKNLTDRLLQPADEAHSHALDQLRLHFMAHRSYALEQLPLLLASERDDNSLEPIAQIQRDLSELHPDDPVVAITKILATMHLTNKLECAKFRVTMEPESVYRSYQSNL